MNSNLTNAIDSLNSTNRFANRRNDSFDKEAWKEQKQKELTDAFSLIDKTVINVFSSTDNMKQYLDLQSRMSNYRAGNVLLILAQRPNSTEVDTFDGWSKRNVSITGGEHGIKILTPVTYTREADGQRGLAFRVTTAFDISQTNAKDKGQKSEMPAPDMAKLLNALLRRSPVPIVADANIETAGYSSNDPTIFVNPEMDDKTAFVHIAVAMAHADGDIAGKSDMVGYLVDFAAAYLVCRRYGLNISSFQFSDDMAHWSQQFEPMELQTMLNDARTEANTIAERMEATLHPPKREQNQQER